MVTLGLAGTPGWITKDQENFDFVLVAGRINAIEKVSVDDCRSFATIEMKLSLLLGLKPLYKEYLLHWFDENGTTEEMTSDSSSEDDSTDVNTVVVETKTYNYPKTIAQINWLLLEKKGMLFFESSYLALGASCVPLDDLIFVLPEFATKSIIPNFEARFELCLAESLPVDLTYQVVYASESELDCILEAYLPWFNMQRHQALDTFNENAFEAKSLSLYKIINAFNNE